MEVVIWGCLYKIREPRVEPLDPLIPIVMYLSSLIY
jgi:hypothetical protein